MKKTTIKERLENAVEAFFEEKNFGENESLTFMNSGELVQNDSHENFLSKAELLLTILRQLFFFLPGTLWLFFMCSFQTIFTMEQTVGVGYSPERLALFLVVSSVMTILGIGNLKSVKHLIIPASIVFFSVTLGIFISFIDDGLFYKCGIYFSPIALIIPFLAKGWIDKTEKE